jgi:hypothetical protein
MSFIHTIERTRTNTPQGAHPPGSIIHKKLLMQNRDKHPGTPGGHRDHWSRFTRCSRPLCSSQTTNPSHPPPHEHPPPQKGGARTMRPRPCAGQSGTNKTQPPRGPGPVVPGPNSVPKDHPCSSTVPVPATGQAGGVLEDHPPTLDGRDLSIFHP